MTLLKYQEVTLAVNNAAAYVPCLRPNRKLMLTAILLKMSQINLNTEYMYNVNSKNRKIDILITLRALLA